MKREKKEVEEKLRAIEYIPAYEKEDEDTWTR